MSTKFSQEWFHETLEGYLKSIKYVPIGCSGGSYSSSLPSSSSSHSCSSSPIVSYERKVKNEIWHLAYMIKQQEYFDEIKLKEKRK